MNRKPQTIVEEIIELDEELLKLLGRRARLLKKTRRPKKEGAGSEGITSEKRIRHAWETAASRFSKDPRLSHQFFNLIQDIEFITREAVEEKPDFNLSPTSKPVNIYVPGPASSEEARLWAALASASGSGCTISGVAASSAVQELVKALNQSGSKAAIESGNIVVRKDARPAFADKVVFAGEDELNFYLLALLACSSHGTMKFTGGSALKEADFTPFRHFIGQLGARIGHVIPRSNGLPARLECSGVIADEINVAADMPREAVIAVLAAACTWNMGITIKLADNPFAAEAHAIVTPLYEACGVEAEGDSTSVTIKAKKIATPANPVIDLDPSISAPILAMAAFGKGKSALKGRWPQSAEGDAALELLRSAGLAVSVTPEQVSAVSTEATRTFTELSTEGLPAKYYPLAVALCCLRADLSGEPVTLPACPEGIDAAVLEGFVAQGRLLLEDDKVFPRANVPAAEVWTSPDAWWTMSLSLMAFIRRGIRLANPISISEKAPFFWTLYNGLPEPTLQRKPRENKDEQPKRRRIIAE